MKKLLAILLLVSATAHADVWKLKQSDGTYIYGNGIMPAGAVKIVVPENSKNTVSSQLGDTSPLTPPPVHNQSNQNQSTQEIAKLRKRVEEAEAALKSGAEPEAGERQGIAGVKGKSRLSENYFERQTKLEDELKQAKEALDRALFEYGKTK